MSLRVHARELRLVLFLVSFSGFGISLTAQSSGFQTSLQIGDRWPPISSYGSMQCFALALELRHMREDLRALQQPAELENTKWQEARNRFGLLVALYSPKCARLAPDQTKIVPPPAVGTPAVVAAAGMKALKNGRLEAAEAWLLDAAEQNDIEAQYNLGMLLYLGGKVAEAETWWRRAASQGSTKAQDALRKKE